MSRTSTYFKIVPLGIFFICISALMIGQSFGSTWAGGDGVRHEVSVTIAGIEGKSSFEHPGSEPVSILENRIGRGEKIKTGEQSYLTLNLGNLAYISLAERTDITLDRLFEDELTITVTRGRVVAEILDPSGNLRIKTNHTETTVDSGVLTLINFDFLENIVLAPITETIAHICTELRCQEIESAITVHETKPIEVEQREYTLDDPFYEWVGE